MFKQTSRIENEIQDSLSIALDSLKWARKHMHDRGTGQTLRMTRASIADIAMALTQEMEGDPERAQQFVLRSKSTYGWDYEDPNMPQGC